MMLMIVSVGNTATIRVALAVVGTVLSLYYLPCAIGKYSSRHGERRKELVLPAPLGVIDQCCGYSFFRSDR